MTEALKLTGAASDFKDQWNAINWNKVSYEVKRLQMRIAKAVKEKKWNKVKALQRILTHSFFAKAHAVRKVSRNKGSRTPGIDGDIWNTPGKRMQGILSLKQKGYKAQPLKRKIIPKSNGKTRPLGIPTMKDRAMQALYLLALEPISETQADTNSYGFRPFRATRDAIGQCFCALAKKNSPTWILEGDIKACFDEIDHNWILDNIPTNRDVLYQWLKCGYMKNSKLFPTIAGTPQGGIISPTIANMVLDGLEQAIKESVPRKSKVNFIRYADDFIVTANSKEMIEQTLIPVIETFLQERGLKLSKEKTKITRIEDGFDFLGQHFRKFRNKLTITPSKKNLKNFLDKVKSVIKKGRQWKASRLIRKLNPILRGWANYHRYIQPAKEFRKADRVIYFSLWKWMEERKGVKGKFRLARKYWNQVDGQKRPWIFTGSENNSKGETMRFQLLRLSDISRLRYIKIKGNSNPFDSEQRKYFIMRKWLSNSNPTQCRTAGFLSRNFTGA